MKINLVGPIGEADVVTSLFTLVFWVFFGWGFWGEDIAGVRFSRMRVARQSFFGGLLVTFPVLSAIGTAWIIAKAGADDVRHDAGEIFIYSSIGAFAVTVIARLVIPFLGISARDDILERGDTAALWPIAAGFAGLTLCYAGANVGNGPDGTEFFCAILAFVAFLLLWFAVESLTDPPLSERVTVERDDGAGIRLGVMLLSIGAILGSAVAGDWQSTEATLRDFVRYGWPAAVVAGLAAVVEQQLRPSPKKSKAPALYAILPSLVYVAIAVLTVAEWGRVH